jgi:hypothetical protein
VFFDGLGDQSEPGPALREAIAKDFGSFEKWRQEFAAIGKALGGCSGWVLLSWSARHGGAEDDSAADRRQLTDMSRRERGPKQERPRRLRARGQSCAPLMIGGQAREAIKSSTSRHLS